MATETQAQVVGGAKGYRPGATLSLWTEIRR